MTENKPVVFRTPLKPMFGRLLKSLEENPMSTTYTQGQLEFVTFFFIRPLDSPFLWDSFVIMFNSLAPGEPDLDEWDVKRAYAEVAKRLEQVARDINLPDFDSFIARKEVDLAD